MSLRDRPARPVAARVAPSYPRALALATALLASSCAIYPLNEQPLSPEGDIAIPFDAEPDTKADAKPDGGTDTDVFTPDATGVAPYPYEAGADTDVPPDASPDASPDGGETSLPDPAGDIAYPYDDAGPGDDASGSGG